MVSGQQGPQAKKRRRSLFGPLAKDTLREIKKTRSRFLSIFLIVALGAGFFAGIKATGPDMKLTGDTYFDDQDLMDAKALSTYGINGDDLAALRAAEGVKTVQPGYSLDVIVKMGGKDTVVKALSYDPGDTLNRPLVVEGRLPQNSGECAINATEMFGDGYQIGDKLVLQSDSGNTQVEDNLRTAEYTIVGRVQSPLYVTYELGSSSIGSGKVSDYLYIPADDFTTEVYTEAYITFTGAKALDCFSDAYKTLRDDGVKTLEAVGEERAQIRYDEVFGEAEKQLDDAQKELDDGRVAGEAELGAARQKLDDAYAQLESGRQQLAENRQLYESGITQGQAQIDEVKKTRGDLQVKYDQLAAAVAQMGPKVEGLKAQIDAMGDPAALPAEQQALYAQLTAQYDQLQPQYAQLQQNAAQVKGYLDQAVSGYAQAKAQFDQQKAEGEAQLQQAAQQIDQGQAEYDQGMADYQVALADFEQQMRDGQQKIDDGRAELQKIKVPVWYINSRQQNTGYAGFEQDADRINNISLVFPVFFFLVAALVCITTMTRMVEEQRTQAGTIKALGYGSWATAAKYLVYAVSAAVLGAVVGLLIGFKLFPGIIFGAYGIMYRMIDVVAPFRWNYALWITLGAAACAGLSVISVCLGELREQPSQLMRPKAPKAGKRVLLERVNFIWRRLSFTGKVTARNLFRYKKRIFMTVLGIAGCTALMLTGFGVKDSISGIVKNQFGTLTRQDTTIVFDEDQVKGDRARFADMLQGRDELQKSLLVRQKNSTVGHGSREYDAYLFVPEKVEQLSDYVLLRHRSDKKPYALGDDGAVIDEKLAQLLHVSAGDEIYLVGDENVRYTLKIADITENYAGHYLYMSPSYYMKVFGAAPAYNAALGILQQNGGQQAEESLSAYLLAQDGVLTVSYTSGIEDNFDDTIGSLNYVVIVLIVCAGLLAFVVLYNLTNINVGERIREIATIKVLGFTDREVSAYIYRENIFLTVFGVAAGLLVGIALHRFVITTAEIDSIMFGRDISALSYLLAALLTVVFSLLVNFAMHYKLKKVDMVESLKSVE